MILRGKIFLLIILPLTTISFAQTDSTIILSEVMFYPSSGPNEFIEIYNYNTTETIDLNDFQIKYSTSNPDVITDAGEGTLLPPQSFAVIFEGDYPFGSGIYDALIPPEALILKISDNSFGSSGMANTSDRPVWLLSSIGDTLESYLYSANNSQSFSDEKIELTKDSSQSNWGNSLIANGTPGFRNSISQLSFDLEVSDLSFVPSVPFEGDDVTVFTTIKNMGLNIANSYSVEIYNDADFDSTADPGELIYSEDFFNLLPGDSIIANKIITAPDPGDYQIISRVVFNDDENLLNNELINTFAVYPPGNNYNDIVINEIMYSPSSGEPEWIELFNRTGEDLNLKKWTISDLTTSATITSINTYIPSEGYIVLTEDSSIINYYNVSSEIIVLNLPSLNNSGDGIKLKDSLNVLIDSVLYSPDWGGNTGGRSLERISVEESSNDPSNWETSISILKATPGRINSITPKEFDLAISSFNPTKDFAVVNEEITFNITSLNKGLNDSQ
ncbi:lamin tail domain-containing protein [Bacteroidota bacterium]